MTPTTRATGTLQLHRLGIYLAFGGAVGLIVGSILPWATISAPLIGEVSKAGTSGDGVFTLIAGVGVGVLAALALAGQRGMWLWIVLVVLGGLSAVVGIIDLVDVARLAADVRDEARGFPVDANPGAGLFVVILGGGLSMAGGVLMALRPRPGQTTGSPPPPYEPRPPPRSIPTSPSPPPTSWRRTLE